MSDHYWLTKAELERIQPYFPRSHGRPRVDDRRVISGIIHVIRSGLRWRDAPEVYGSHRPSITASSDGRGWASLIEHSVAWHPAGQSLTPS